MDDDLKDPAEDSDSESGNSSDNLSDWTPLYRPHFSSHGNKPPLRAQLSDTERASRQGRGEKTRGEEKPDTDDSVFMIKQAAKPVIHINYKLFWYSRQKGPLVDLKCKTGTTKSKSNVYRKNKNKIFLVSKQFVT